MRLAFMDETGLSDPAHEPWVIVAAVIIDGDSVLSGVRAALERLLTRTIPSSKSPIPLSNDHVFHATEIFSGRGDVFKKPEPDLVGPHQWPLERRLELAMDIARIFKSFRLPIAFGTVERSSLSTSMILPSEANKAHKTVSAHVVAHNTAVCMIEHFMRREAPGENCLLVVEDNQNARSHIRDFHILHQDRRIADFIAPSAEPYFPWKRIQSDPLFQPKRRSSPLILADFAAFVFKRELMGDQRYEKYVDQFRADLITFKDRRPL